MSTAEDKMTAALRTMLVAAALFLLAAGAVFWGLLKLVGLL